MRNFSLVFLPIVLLLCCGMLYAQPDTLWTARVSATQGVNLNGAAELSDGGFLVVGGSQQMFAAKLSSTGEVIWSRTLATDGQAEQAYAAVEASPTAYVIVGYGRGGRSIMLYAVSHNGDSLWSRQYNNGTGLTKGYDAALLQDGNFAVTGYTLDAAGQHSDVWLLKCNANGDTLWTRLFGTAETDIGQRIAERADRSFVLAVQSRAADYNFEALRVDASGTQLSSHDFGTTAQDFCYGLSNGDSVVYISGASAATGDNDGYLLKVTGNGDSVWVHSYTMSEGDEQLRGVVALQEGGAMSVGWTHPSGTVRGWLLITNPEGVVTYTGHFGPDQCALYGILQASGGGQLVFGQVFENGANRGYIARLIAPRGISGVVTHTLGGEPVGGARVTAVGLNRYVITDSHGRYTLGLDPATYDIFAYGPCVSRDTIRNVTILPDSISRLDLQVGFPNYSRLESSLNMEVHNRVDFSGDFHIRNSGDGTLEYSLLTTPISPATSWLTVSPQTGYVLAGDTAMIHVNVHADTTDEAVWDYYGTLRVHVNSCPDSADLVPVFVSVLDVGDQPNTLPKDFSLAAYPNPFNPLSTISLALPHASVTKLEVFDITGRSVAVLADGLLEAGEHRFAFDGQALPSGLYFARVTSEAFHATQKLMLLK